MSRRIKVTKLFPLDSSDFDVDLLVRRNASGVSGIIREDGNHHSVSCISRNG